MKREDDAAGRTTMRKVGWRLLPLISLIFLVNNMDRVNVSFAALTMNEDLDLSTLAYAWGAGIFFIAYFLFEIPSNLMIERVGARVWMTRIMVSWGLVSGAMAFVTGMKSFLLVRFLLGAAEAGLVPGMVLYIGYWFPPRWQGRAMAIFMLSAPLSFVVAGLLSRPILAMEGVGGLHGWQWMFMIEALPSVLLGGVTWYALVDRPADAAWLSDAEKAWLSARTQQPPAHPDIRSELGALANRRVGLLSLVYFGRTTAMYGIALFLPLIVKGMGVANASNGFISALPFVAATIGSYMIGWNSDRSGERHWHTAATMGLAAIGLVAAGIMGPSIWALAWISVAAIGLYAQPSTFWAIPNALLPRVGAAAGIAAINAVGNFGGFVGPYLVGWTQTVTGSYSIGLYLLAGSAAFSGLLGLIIKRLRWEPEGQAADAVPL